jgi:hypothetical protein
MPYGHPIYLGQGYNMYRPLPHDVPPSNPFYIAWNKLCAWMRANQLSSSDDILVTTTSNGTSLKLAKRPAQSVVANNTTSGSGCQMFAIKTLSNSDYYVAQTWDGVNLGSQSIVIAKPTRLRTSIAKEIIDGATITYSSYTSDNTRTASDGTNIEYQVAFPRFTAYSGSYPSGSNDMSVIFAIQPSNGSGLFTVSSSISSSIAWQEIGPARVWARRYIQ